jgi:tetratricopeptide (TPR) repeat protein
MAPREARRAASWVALSWVLSGAIGLHGVAPTSVRGQDLDGTLHELTDIEQRVTQLKASALRGSELRSPTYVEERLTDGELFFRLRDYVRASIILTDIVENYPKHQSYPDALFLLGESLFHASDYLGARARFRLILDHADVPGYRSRVQPALARLIEIAIRIRDFTGVDGYFERLARLPPSEVEAATAYFRAKYLYSLAVPTDALAASEGPLPQVDPQKLEQARVAFDAVAANGPYAMQSHYYIGVIYTLRGQYNPAIDSFKLVIGQKAQDDTQREIVELALLSLGRLYYETDQVKLALDAYQSISRTSKRFETALFETAWTYIRQGDSTRAERSLEVLTVAAPESQYIPDAKILRGNLLLRDGRYDAAGGVFAEVISEFQPVRNQLDQLITQQADPPGYFRDLVKQNLVQFDDEAFLPPLALRWAKIEGDMRRAVDAVSDLSQARQLSGETADVVERLNNALAAKNRVNIFPDLRAQRESSVALRNRLSRVRQQLIAADEAQTKQYNNAELGTVSTQRRALERSLAALPTKAADFERRNSDMDGHFLVLDKQLSTLEVQLLGMDARIVATERFIADTMKSEKERSSVEAYRSELQNHRAAMADYREQIARLKQDLEASRLQVGVGDSVYSHDDDLRAQHAQLVARERQLIAALGGRTTGGVDDMFRRASAVEAALDARDQLVDQVVDERARDMLRVLTEEGGKLAGYRQSIAQLDGETEDVVGGISYANYRQVQQRFYDLVMKADVGVVDVGWAEREEHRTRVELLTRERARSTQALDDEFKEIMDDRGTP